MFGVMDDPTLDKLLDAYRERPRGSLPGSFQQNVWREIRRRKADDEARAAAPWAWLLELVLRPQMVLAVLAFALVLGTAIGVQRPVREAAMTRAALDLQVFGGASPSLPSTLLASNLKL
jgi:hypothetical protein